ncbi:hypothetical protein [Aliiroseovarius sp. YM-037]|uniref:hypothetical protein n=1 Tax=Aliiroseovarius sp. YM-037 TaxID=3341728 RepID=UPI003A80FAB3
MASTVKQGAVKRRRVFYIPGYDPFPPRRYRELYRKESALQAEISGYDISIAPNPDGENFGWSVDAMIDGVQTKTEVEVLVWSDIVQRSMSASIFVTYVRLVKTSWIYTRSGALFRLAKTRKGPVIAALYPIFMLLLQLAVALLIGWGIGAVVALLHPMLGWVAAGLTIIILLHWFRKLDGKIFAYYLMQDYAHSAQHDGATPPALAERLGEFQNYVTDSLRSDVDEVLIVGHSSGAHLAVMMLTAMLRSGRVPADGPVLSFLTLGHVVPMVSFLPKADCLRRDLREMSEQALIPWVDVTAPGDGCAFALCDPVAVTGVAREAKKWPLVFSAAFTQSLSAERWASLRWRFFRLHFQYLCAFDRPRDYDYFQITAGPKTLWDRYRDRVPSRSRLETPLSGYRSVAE